KAGLSSTGFDFAGRNRYLLDNLDAEPFQCCDAPRMVGEQSDSAQIQVGKDLRANSDLPLRLAFTLWQCGKAPVSVERQQGFIGHALDGKAFGSLVQINECSAALAGDGRHGAFDAGVAVASCSSEDISHQAMRVHTH